MAVFQPSGIIGNGRALIGVGEKGELMSFYYPHIDFPQNLNQGMPALYFGEAGKGTLEWTFLESWNSEQGYREKTDILQTVCRHHSGLELAFTDFLMPDLPVLVRRVEIHNAGTESFQGTFYQYLDLQLGEVQAKNGLRWIPDQGCFMQYWRNSAFAVGGDTFDQHGCGKAIPDSSNSAKLGMEQGRLNFNPQEIGDVDLAIGWDLALAPGESAQKLLLLAAGEKEEDAAAHLAEAKSRGFESLLSQVEQNCRTFLAKALPLQIPEEFAPGYWRSLLQLRMLFDQCYGTFLAAPEFDPGYERSGGYGYCWPRDAAEVVLGLEAAGLPEMGRRFLAWAVKAQKEDGSWEQRYWLNGQRAPAWCTLEGHVQLDQVGSMLMAMARQLADLPAAEQATARRELWPAVEKAGTYLGGQLDPKIGLHRAACDLWETFCGHFTYTNAAVWAGLKAGAQMAQAVGEAATQRDWETKAGELKQITIKRLWTGNFFARGIDASGRIDPVVDSSILGLVDPFGLLDLNDLKEREMAEACVEIIERHLTMSLNGFKAIGRFEGDHYLGGSAGGCNTLWMARVLLRFALVYQALDRAQADRYRQKALDYIRVVQARATKAGMLPELIGGPDLSDYWAAPHGWTTASYIVNMILLNQLGGE
jgi:oligosaccharide amylase